MKRIIYLLVLIGLVAVVSSCEKECVCRGDVVMYNSQTGNYDTVDTTAYTKISTREKCDEQVVYVYGYPIVCDKKR